MTAYLQQVKVMWERVDARERYLRLQEEAFMRKREAWKLNAMTD